jgi:hypothetical protein
MSQFILIDLKTQADEVTRYIHGWAEERILQWLGQYGEVKKIHHPYDNRLYSFSSYNGSQTGFRITEEGHLIIMGQHTTYLPN